MILPQIKKPRRASQGIGIASFHVHAYLQQPSHGKWHCLPSQDSGNLKSEISQSFARRMTPHLQSHTIRISFGLQQQASTISGDSPFFSFRSHGHGRPIHEGRTIPSISDSGTCTHMQRFLSHLAGTNACAEAVSDRHISAIKARETRIVVVMGNPLSKFWNHTILPRSEISLSYIAQSHSSFWLAASYKRYNH